MKKFTILFFSCFVVFFISAQSQKTFHSYKAITIQGDTISLKKYYGKKLLVVNTASYCGYTYEFGHLQQLYSQYKKYNFEVIGFPCNDFGQQDPGSDSAIITFCTDNYGVTFQMMSRIAIISRDTADVYKWLMRKELNGVKNAAVTWNFNKFMIDEAGNWVRHILSPVSPLDTSITNWILSPSVLPPNIIVTSEQSIATDPQATFLEQESIVTSVEDGSNIPGIIFRSPNPAISSIDIIVPAYKQLSVKILGMDGRLIDAIYEGSTASQQQISYPVTALPTGMYFLQIIADGKRETIKYAVAR